MPEPLRLMCVFAHPDDESMGTGGTLARYADEGIETFLVVATRGEMGWQGAPDQNPGPHKLGERRTTELMEAARVLGLQEVQFLGYLDGELDRADPGEAIARITAHLRRVRPHVVVTFGPDGAYGHPDHIAISQFTSAAIVAAADATYDTGEERRAHRVSKLYHMVVSRALMEAYLATLGDIVMPVDGVDRRGVVWEEWAITTWIHAEEYWKTAWRAVACHRSQLPPGVSFEQLTEPQHRALWRRQPFYRAMSLVNGGRAPEYDLFEGLR